MAATFDIDTVLPEGWRRGEEHDETEIECVFYGGEITSHFWKFDRSEPLLARNRDVVAATIPRIEGSTFPPPPPRCGLALARTRFSGSGKLYLPRCSRGKHRDAENRNRAKLLAGVMLEQTRTRTKTYFPPPPSVENLIPRCRRG